MSYSYSGFKYGPVFSASLVASPIRSRRDEPAPSPRDTCGDRLTRTRLTLDGIQYIDTRKTDCNLFDGRDTDRGSYGFYGSRCRPK
eukprot:7379053-Prymnesium_polylepis.1